MGDGSRECFRIRIYLARQWIHVHAYVPVACGQICEIFHVKVDFGSEAFFFFSPCSRRELWVVLGALYTGTGPWWSCPQGRGPQGLAAPQARPWTDTACPLLSEPPPHTHARLSPLLPTDTTLPPSTTTPTSAQVALHWAAWVSVRRFGTSKLTRDLLVFACETCRFMCSTKFDGRSLVGACRTPDAKSFKSRFKILAALIAAAVCDSPRFLFGVFLKLGCGWCSSGILCCVQYVLCSTGSVFRVYVLHRECGVMASLVACCSLEAMLDLGLNMRLILRTKCRRWDLLRLIL